MKDYIPNSGKRFFYVPPENIRKWSDMVLEGESRPKRL